MTKQELDKMVSSLKSEGYSEQDVLAGFYKLYTDEKLSLEELEGIVNLMGYHLSDEFKNASEDKKKEMGFGKGDTDKVEDEIDDNAEKEKSEDSEDDEDDSEDEKGKAKDKDEDDSEDDEEESEDEKKAMKLFGVN